MCHFTYNPAFLHRERISATESHRTAAASSCNTRLSLDISSLPYKSTLVSSTMKISVTSVLLSSLFAAANANVTPYRVSFDTLQDTLPDTDDALLKALTETGMISVTTIPMFQDAARTMVATQHACLMASAQDDKTQQQTYPDGTIRVTLGTHTVAGNGGRQPLKHAAHEEACILFEEAAMAVRQATQEVVAAFATRLTKLLPVTPGPLLVTEETEDTPAFAFATFTDVVENGEHLEHFHSYQKTTTTNARVPTIQLHTDQGLFLAFTPGRLTSGALTNGFFIRTQDGSVEQVDFSDDDELVFMLGDGVNQYVNYKIPEAQFHLRAAPHAVQLEASEQARVWYGLMVLPPASALHPAYDVSFGAIRQALVSGDEQLLPLACSRSDSLIERRRLAGEATTCENAEEVYCWHRCMNATDFGVSEEICAGRNLELKCVNPRDQVYLGEKHGDYFPACAGLDWENETEFSTLPDYPRDDAKCTGFADYFDDDMYANTINLLDSSGNLSALFQYNVSEGNHVYARLSYDGIFGYLAFGFQGTGGFFTMFNASIVLAMRAGGYTPKYGFNFTMDPEVHEYITSIDQTSFRHWSTPYSDEDGDHDGNGTTATERRSGGRALHGGENHYLVSTQHNGCFTSLIFHGETISGRAFNLKGSDTLIWAADSVDSFMQYHGGERGNFTVDWTADSASTKNSKSVAAPVVNAVQGTLMASALAALFAIM
jgi:hypothetical protein